MLSAAWEFTKRHKGKIITGGILIGGAIAYAAGTTNSKRTLVEEANVNSELPNQARRHYIFDSTHRSCDQSITDLIPSLTTQIEARFEIEEIKEKLDNPSLSLEQKLAVWDYLKKNVICRIVSVAYCFSILTLTLKAQISILAADTCSQFENRNDQNSLKKYLPNYLQGNNSNGFNGNDNASEVANRRVFLQTIQYFTSRGVPRMLEIINDAVNTEMEQWSLQSVRRKEDIQELFDRIGSRISVDQMITKFVAPLEDESDMENHGLYSSSILKLIQKLKSGLESPRCTATLNSLVDFYFSASLKTIQGDAQPLAKFIPTLSNSYQIITSTAFDSPLFNSLYSSDVHAFSVFIFNFNN